MTIAVLLAVFGSMAIAAQDKYTLKAPNGVAFAEFRGYEAWPTVAVSETPTAASPSASSSAMGQEDGLKAILANPVMIKAYQAGIPGNGKPFPDGSKIAKIEWSKRRMPVSPYAVTEPDSLRSVAVIQKDSKRFRGYERMGICPVCL